MAVLEQFGFSEFSVAFKKAGGVHEIWNMISLQHDLHNKFDRLDMWLKETEKVCFLQSWQTTLLVPPCS
jgi:hypothetical protein